MSKYPGINRHRAVIGSRRYDTDSADRLCGVYGYGDLDGELYQTAKGAFFLVTSKRGITPLSKWETVTWLWNTGHFDSLHECETHSKVDSLFPGGLWDSAEDA